jgi:hypothetical protein
MIRSLIQEIGRRIAGAIVSEARLLLGDAIVQSLTIAALQYADLKEASGEKIDSLKAAYPELALAIALVKRRLKNSQYQDEIGIVTDWIDKLDALSGADKADLAEDIMNDVHERLRVKLNKN